MSHEYKNEYKPDCFNCNNMLQLDYDGEKFQVGCFTLAVTTFDRVEIKNKNMCHVMKRLKIQYQWVLSWVLV